MTAPGRDDESGVAATDGSHEVALAARRVRFPLVACVTAGRGELLRLA